MLNKKILLFIAIATVLFTSCDFEPSVIHETDCKVFAACAVRPTWVGNELYDYVFVEYAKSISDGDEEESGDFVFEEGDDMWNIELLTDHERYYGGEWVGNVAATSNDLIKFLFLKGAPSKAEYPNMDRPLSKNDLGYYYEDGKQYYGYHMIYFYNKDRAFKTVYDMCGGDLKPFKEQICQQVEVYEYREDIMSSTERVTVYDVVYKIKGETYAWCSVSDLDDGTFEINFVKSSNMFSNLGY